MTAVEEIVETELERVERWRSEELMRAGYDPAGRTVTSRRGSTSICTRRPS